MDQPVSVTELRDEIASIDGQIIGFIATRADIADELAKAKRRPSQGYRDSANEKRIVERHCDLCKEVSLTKDEAEQIARAILSIPKGGQKKIYGSANRCCERQS